MNAHRWQLHALCAALTVILIFFAVLLHAVSAQASEIVEINKGKLIRLSAAAYSVAIADQNIADVQVISPKLIYVNGRTVGETSISPSTRTIG
jgi:pilus assembly protein CpaC